MKKKMLIAAGVLVLAGGGAAAYHLLDRTADSKVRDAVAEFQKSLGDGESFSYQALDVKLSGSVQMADVAYSFVHEGQPIDVTADTVSVAGPQMAQGRVTGFDVIDFTGLESSHVGAAVSVLDGSVRGLRVDNGPEWFQSVDGVDLDTVRISDGVADITLSRIEGEGISRARIDRLEVRELESRGGAVAEVAGGSGSAPDHITADLVRVEQADFDNLWSLAQRDDEPAPDKVVDALRQDGLSGFVIEGLTSYRDGSEVGRLGRLQVSMMPEDDGAFAFDMSYQDSVSKVNAGAEVFTRPLQALGYEELRADGRTTVKWHPEAGTMSLDRIEIDVADFGALRLGAALEDLPAPGSVDAAADRREAMAKKVAIANLSLTFTDAGIVDRVVRAGAEQAGEEVAAYRAMHVAHVRDRAMQSGYPELGDKIAAFLENPGTIEISMAPDRKVPAGQAFLTAMMTPDQMVETLGLTVSVTP